jgi:hypothetical protein
MRPSDAAVKAAIENYPAADPRSNRHIDESRLVLARAPDCLGHGGSIGIVF